MSIKKQYDYSKLKGRIIEKFGTQFAFAESIGWHNGRVSRVLNNKSGLSQDEMSLWCEALEIELCDIGFLFFCPSISQM